MRLLLLKILVLCAVILTCTHAFAQTLELGMPRDSVMLRMRQARMREGDASKTWDIEFQPAVFVDLSGIYSLGFDKSNRLEYIAFNQHIGDKLPSDVWTKIVGDFKKRKPDSLKEEHALVGDSYSWRKSGNAYALTNMKGFLSYTAFAPSAVQNPKRRVSSH
jgi:hypothetical protein